MLRRDEAGGGGDGRRFYGDTHNKGVVHGDDYDYDDDDEEGSGHDNNDDDGGYGGRDVHHRMR